MELIDLEKYPPEVSGLRLVADNKEPHQFPVIQKQFVNFIFFRVNSDWRKLSAENKRVYKAEFERVFSAYNKEMLLFN